MRYELLLLLLIPALVNASSCKKQIKVAVIDTGLNLTDPRFTRHLCKTGHRNFVRNETINDIRDHGTMVAGLIEKYAGNANYCMLIYKYYSDDVTPKLNVRREVYAIQAAIDNGATVVNFSGGGTEFDEGEAFLIRNHPEITFVVAAGNDGKNLDIPGNTFYPASLFYKNIEVIESIDSNGVLSPYSNYTQNASGKEVGQDVTSYVPNGLTQSGSGTSFSAAIFSGKLVDKLSKTCQYR